MLSKTYSCVFALTVATAFSASAAPFSQVVTFSGALSDNGNFVAESQQPRPAPFFENRSTNGPAAVEVMAEALGLEAKPSMHLVGKDGGTNFAVADALAGGNGPHDLPAEIDAHLARNGGKADPDALYFMFIGGNDVIKAVATRDDAEANKILDDAVLGFETQLKRLVAAGARTIYAPDFIDLGYAPGVTAYGPEATARATALSKKYNSDFEAMLDRVDDGSFRLIRWSFGDFVDRMMAHKDDFGFVDVSSACLEQPAEACDLEKFVFLTPEYPTARVHRLLGNALALAILDGK